MALPEGFVINEPKADASGLPEGFSVVQDDVPTPVEPASSGGGSLLSAMNILPPGMQGDGGVDRALGLTARDAVQGVLSLPAMGMDAVASVVYAALDAAGVEHKDAYMSQGIRRGLDSIGLPTPEGAIEEFSSAVTQGLASGGGLLKVAQKGAKSLDPIVKGISEKLSRQPISAIGGGGTGPALSEGARQAGFGPKTQFAAGLIGSAAFPTRFDIPKPGIGLKPPRASKIETAESALQTKARSTSAQKSGTPMDLARQDVVSHHPKLQKNLKAQNTESARLLTKHLNSIAPDVGAVSAGASGRTAAGASISRLKAERSAATRPLYTKARASKTVANTSSLQKSIRSKISEVEPGLDPITGKEIPDTIVSTLETFASRVRAARGNINKLHNAKKWADEALRKTGDNDLGYNTKRLLTDSKNELVEILRKTSKDYDEAYLKHSEMSKPIKQMQESLVGILSDADNVQLEGTLTKIFNSDIKEVMALKRVLDIEDPSAFAAMYRTHMQKLFKKTSFDATEAKPTAGLTQNVPEEFWNAIFKNSDRYGVLLESAPTNASRQNLRYLRDVIGSYRTGRANVSGSAERAAAVSEIEGTIGAISRFMSSAVFHPVTTAAARTTKGIAKGKIQGRVEVLVDSLIDPKYEDAWTVLRRLDPKSAVAARTMEQILIQSQKDQEE